MGSEWEQSLERVNERVRGLNRAYKSGDQLLQEVVRGAISWVPQYLAGTYKPNADQLLDMGSKLVAVGIATELDSMPRRVGY